MAKSLSGIDAAKAVLNYRTRDTAKSCQSVAKGMENSVLLNYKGFGETVSNRTLDLRSCGNNVREESTP